MFATLPPILAFGNFSSCPIGATQSTIITSLLHNIHHHHAVRLLSLDPTIHTRITLCHSTSSPALPLIATSPPLPPSWFVDRWRSIPTSQRSKTNGATLSPKIRTTQKRNTTRLRLSFESSQKAESQTWTEKYGSHDGFGLTNKKRYIKGSRWSTHTVGCGRQGLETSYRLL